MNSALGRGDKWPFKNTLNKLPLSYSPGLNTANHTWNDLTSKAEL